MRISTTNQYRPRCTTSGLPRPCHSSVASRICLVAVALVVVCTTAFAVTTKTGSGTISSTGTLLSPSGITVSESVSVSGSASSSSSESISGSYSLSPSQTTTTSVSESTSVSASVSGKSVTKTVPATATPEVPRTPSKTHYTTTTSVSPTSTPSSSASESMSTTLYSLTNQSTVSVSILITATISPAPTPTTSIALTMTASLPATPSGSIPPTSTVSITQSVSVSTSDSTSITLTPPPTPTVSFSTSESITVTVTPPPTPTPTPSKTAPITETVSLPPTASETPTRTFPMTQSESIPPTPSLTATMSFTTTTSISVSPSSTFSVTDSLPITATKSFTVSDSIPDTRSQTFTNSETKTATASLSGGSETPTNSLPRTLSSPITTTYSIPMTSTISLPTTASETVTISISTSTSTSQSASVSVSDSTSVSQSISTSASVSLSTSVTESTSISTSGTMSLSTTTSMSISGTPSLTTTLTTSLSQSATVTVSESSTLTLSMTMSQSETDGTASQTISFPITTSVIPPTTTPVPTPTMTLPTSCPEDCMNGVCSKAPQWDFVYYCNCYQSPAKGFWRGSEQGGPCDKCKLGYFGADCLQVCPGGTCSLCGGHGICNDGRFGDGLCVCFTDPVEGYWTGPTCTLCEDNYYGLSCTEKCPCSEFGTVRCDAGRFGSGACECSPGWSGDLCQDCDPSIIADCSSAVTCPGPAENPCNDNGNCTRLPNVINGVCDCFPYYGTPDCGKKCPNQCSSRGTCSQGRTGTGDCTCDPRFAQPDCANCVAGYYGTSCSNICPGGVLTPCSNNGTCQRDGFCNCSGVSGGTSCNMTCPLGVNKTVCSNHGVCTGADAHCQCYNDTTNGFWAGTKCDVCAPTHGGSKCRVECPSSLGQICSGPSNGFCNVSSGACVCTFPNCGKSCDVQFVMGECATCPNPLAYGPLCDQICACVNGVCDAGKGGDGTCECTPGWAGPNCDIECKGGATTPCSGHGSCDVGTGQCGCVQGYGGEACNSACPHPTCNNNGVCNDTSSGDGTCTCTAGYVWPQTGCDQQCSCNGHGVCSFPNIACVCDANFTTGAYCERCPAGYWNSSTCTSKCINGVTNGYDCDCLPGWGGLDCSILCPFTSNGPCNGQGVCRKQDGKCTCTEWVGPACQCHSVKTCEAANPFTQCNVLSGICVCKPKREGSQCESCFLGYYGATCTIQCDCSGNGPCDITTGLCKCYGDDTRGYWSGGSCSICLEGFMGQQCTQKSNAVSFLPVLRVTNKQDVRQLYAYHDKIDKRLYIGGSPLNAVFDVSAVLATQLSSSVVTTDKAGNTICGDITGVTRMGMSGWVNRPEIGTPTMMVIVQRNVSCSANIRMYASSPTTTANATLVTPNAFYAVLSEDFAQYLTYYFHDETTNTICGIPSFDISSQELYCRDLNNPTGITNYVPLPTRNLRGAILSTSDPSTIYLSGLDRNINCAIQVAKIRGGQPEVQPIQFIDFVSMVNESCQIVDCVTEVDGILYFVAIMRSAYVGAYHIAEKRFYQPVNIGVSSQRCNAITYDTESNIGFVVLQQKVLKFTKVTDGSDGSVKVSRNFAPEATTTTAPKPLPKLVAYGQTYITSSYVSKLITDTPLQLVYAPLSLARGLEVQRFLLLEVTDFEPKYAERPGGTKILVKGRGFRNTTTLQCKFASAIVKGTYVDKNTLTCISPLVVSTRACVSEELEVSTTGIIFTQNKLLIERPSSPALTDAVPSFVRVATPELVRISGQALPYSPKTICKFSDPGESTFYSNATYDLGSYACMSPNTSFPWSPQSNVQISLDGQTFGTSSLTFLIIGSAAGIVAEPLQVEGISANNVNVYNKVTGAPVNVTVYVVDVRGNKLGTVDSGFNRNISLQIDTPYSVGPILTANGKAPLGDLLLQRPRAISWVGRLVSLSLGWRTEFTVIIVPGLLSSIAIRSKPLQGDDYLQPGRPIPRQAEIEALDVAGNAVLNSFNVPINVTLVVVNSTGTQLRFYDNETQNLNQILISSSGLAVLDQRILFPRFGTKYLFYFALASNASVYAKSDPFFPRCEANLFYVNGERECRACMSTQAVCNGTDFLKPFDGFWRSSAASLTFYECPQTGTCIGGGLCKEGYMGPMCTVCQAGYGKSYLNECEACMDVGPALTMLILIIIIILALLVLMTVLVVQNYTKPQSKIGRIVTTIIIFVTYLQTISILGLLDMGWPDEIAATMTLIGVFSDLKVYTIGFVNCLFTDIDVTAAYIALIYSALPLVAFLVGGISMVIVRYKPNILCSQEVIAERVESRERFISTKRSTVDSAALLRNRRRNDREVSAFGKTAKKAKVTPVSESMPDDELAKGWYVKSHHRKGLSLVTIQVIIFFLYQSISIAVFQMFDCISIQTEGGKDASYLRADMRVRCDDAFFGHISSYASFVALMFAFVLPVLCTIGIGLARKRYSLNSYRLYTSMVTFGTRDSAFFWQGLVMFRKILIICFVVFASHPIDGYLTVWVVTLSIALTSYINPYTDPLHNRQEIASLASVALSGNLGYLFKTVDSPEVHDVVSYILVAIVVITVLYFMWEIVGRLAMQLYDEHQLRNLEVVDTSRPGLPTRKAMRAEVKRAAIESKSKQQLIREELSVNPNSPTRAPVSPRPQFSEVVLKSNLGSSSTRFSRGAGGSRRVVEDEDLQLEEAPPMMALEDSTYKLPASQEGGNTTGLLVAPALDKYSEMSSILDRHSMSNREDRFDDLGPDHDGPHDFTNERATNFSVDEDSYYIGDDGQYYAYDESLGDEAGEGGCDDEEGYEDESNSEYDHYADGRRSSVFTENIEYGEGGLPYDSDMELSLYAPDGVPTNTPPPENSATVHTSFAQRGSFASRPPLVQQALDALNRRRAEQVIDEEDT